MPPNDNNWFLNAQTYFQLKYKNSLLDYNGLCVFQISIFEIGSLFMLIFPNFDVNLIIFNILICENRL